MENKKYYNPVEVVQSSKWLDTCKEGLKNLGMKFPLIITSNGGLKRLNLDSIFSPDSIFTAITPNPTFERCQQAIDFCRNKQFDGIIAIGGGSVMDTAKTVKAALGTGLMDINDLLSNKKPFFNRIPSIFIPTTHGTASEVTMWGTIWNTSEKKKYSISHPDLYPDIAILDGSLTFSLPLDISLTTVLDALSHSFEAIWNKNANSKSTEYAIKAICLILENVKKLKSDLNNIAMRTELLRASNIAGLAFSNTKTAAAHSIGYPLTAHFGIPHGIASSISLMPLLNINAAKIEKPLASVLRRLGIGHLEDLKEIIKKIPKPELKYSLREWGAKYDDLEWLVDLSFTKERMDNNVVNLTKDSLRWILEEIY